MVKNPLGNHKLKECILKILTKDGYLGIAIRLYGDRMVEKKKYMHIILGNDIYKQMTIIIM